MDVDLYHVKLQISNNYGQPVNERLIYLIHDELFYEHVAQLENYNYRPRYWASTTRVRITMP